ncbi:hypothetical protein GN958_ATG05136 [Phytophthora infestans]|uniref:Uncharacterized protein n=1 Tax=Phytophthora infestans TaxID=4787 RepID=A0A8S9V2G5_PHYIN|nr:hypothetical protein GN958_ATG05136 [Phytophthora infestans]
MNFVPDLGVSEEVLYCTRHEIDAEQEAELESVHFEQDPETTITESLSGESMGHEKGKGLTR